MATKNAKIIQGEDIILTVSLVDSVTGDPFALPGFTSATATMAGTVTPQISNGSLVSADLGKINFPFTAIQTAALLIGTGVNLEVVVTQGTQITIAQILGKIDVVAKLF